jgi:hypothetical protein
MRATIQSGDLLHRHEPCRELSIRRWARLEREVEDPAMGSQRGIRILSHLDALRDASPRRRHAVPASVADAGRLDREPPGSAAAGALPRRRDALDLGLARHGPRWPVFRIGASGWILRLGEVQGVTLSATGALAKRGALRAVCV